MSRRVSRKNLKKVTYDQILRKIGSLMKRGWTRIRGEGSNLLRFAPPPKSPIRKQEACFCPITMFSVASGGPITHERYARRTARKCRIPSRVVDLLILAADNTSWELSRIRTVDSKVAKLVRQNLLDTTNRSLKTKRRPIADLS